MLSWLFELSWKKSDPPLRTKTESGWLRRWVYFKPTYFKWSVNYTSASSVILPVKTYLQKCLAVFQADLTQDVFHCLACLSDLLNISNWELIHSSTQSSKKQSEQKWVKCNGAEAQAFLFQNIQKIHKVTTVWVKYFASLAHEIEFLLNCRCYLTLLTE